MLGTEPGTPEGWRFARQEHVHLEMYPMQGLSRLSRLPFEALLRPFGKVHRSEVATIVLMTTYAFLMLTAYYVLKVVREPLILAEGGAEVKRYAAAGQALLLFLGLRYYDRLAGKVSRLKLIAGINLFFASNLVLFFVLGIAGFPVAIAFYLWVGIFNIAVIAQFWAFANDVYSPEAGGRLFAIIGIGSSLGAIFGAQVSGWLFEPLGPFLLMPLAAALLLVCVSLAWAVHRRETVADGRPIGIEGVPDSGNPPGAGLDSLRLVMRDRYLLLVALLTLLLNWVGTLGEYVLDLQILGAARDAVHTGQSPDVEAFIGAFRSDFFKWVGILALVLQMFVVSRVMRHLGVGVALFVLPIVALVGYGAMIVVPILVVISVAKVAESGIAYSLYNTARHALYLVTGREAKYKAKTFTDTFVWRVGDLVAAGTVAAGTALALETRGFLWITLALVVVWLALTIAAARIHRRRSLDWTPEGQPEVNRVALGHGQSPRRSLIFDARQSHPGTLRGSVQGARRPRAARPGGSGRRRYSSQGTDR
jgi:AAA family ATP:ADP antiporter